MVNLATRLWQKDPSLWGFADNPSEVTDWLGWLDAIDWMIERTPALTEWVTQIVNQHKFDRVLVLGMGGSSLAPELFAKLFDSTPGFPALAVLDSTSPEMVAQVMTESTDIKRTLFIVASKSGTTLETMDLYRYFYSEIEKNNDVPGKNFIAITDQDSWLHHHAEEKQFAKVFLNPEDIGGRYSALSYFGIIPAALYGIDIAELLNRANQYSQQTKLDDPNKNSALNLGNLMGQNAQAGRNKLLLKTSPKLHSLASWIEQLVAESTGKAGQGILPVALRELTTTDLGVDTYTIEITDQPIIDTDQAWCINDPLDIGAELFKWECATAIAASYLQINPFDQPNVAEAKQNTNQFIKGHGQLKTQTINDQQEYALELVAVESNAEIGENKLPFIPSQGNYIAILAYLPMQPAIEQTLEALQQQLMATYNISVTIGFGPRYLHSTGQLHKGGPEIGQFIQLISDDKTNYDVPNRGYTFSELFRAQADGDLAVLAEHNLPTLRVNLKEDRLTALKCFIDDITY